MTSSPNSVSPRTRRESVPRGSSGPRSHRRAVCSSTYARTEAGAGALYGLADDPFELKDLAHDPAHAALRERMEAQALRLDGADGRFADQ